MTPLEDEIQITVIATGFDGNARANRAPRVDTPNKSGKTIEFPVKNLDQDDLDIPSFLRRTFS